MTKKNSNKKKKAHKKKYVIVLMFYLKKTILFPKINVLNLKLKVNNNKNNN